MRRDRFWPHYLPPPQKSGVREMARSCPGTPTNNYYCCGAANGAARLRDFLLDSEALNEPESGHRNNFSFALNSSRRTCMYSEKMPPVSKSTRGEVRYCRFSLHSIITELLNPVTPAKKANNDAGNNGSQGGVNSVKAQLPFFVTHSVTYFLRRTRLARLC